MFYSIHSLIRKFWCFFLFFFGGCLSTFVQAREIGEVIVLANSNDPESVELAEFYIEQRQLPAQNIVLLPLPQKAEITWAEFSSQIYNPLQNKLIEKGWLDGSTGNVFDTLGREQKVVFSHNIKYLVLCRGVPLKIKHDDKLLPTVIPPGMLNQFKKNHASVDSELALLPQSGIPAIAAIDNPFFNKKKVSKFDSNKAIRVSRLDGPSVKVAKRLVEDALYAEKHGLMGRAYVDLHKFHQEGEDWLIAVMKLLIDEGFDLSVEKTRTLYPRHGRFDAPAFYFGWYSSKPAGVFKNDFQRFVRGAIAFHLYSFSASQLTDFEKSWVPHLLEKGAAVSFGNVYEPYLGLTHRPNIFLQAVIDGQEVGEAGMMSITHLSWQGVVIGDPLYRPFAIPLAEQLSSHSESGNYPYAMIRKANLLLEGGQQSEAFDLLNGLYLRKKHPAVALRLAQIAYDRSEYSTAMDRLSVFEVVKPKNEWVGLHLEAVKLANLIKKFDFSKNLLSRLISTENIDKSLVSNILQKSIALAKKYKWHEEKAKWEKKLKKI